MKALKTSSFFFCLTIISLVNIVLAESFGQEFVLNERDYYFQIIEPKNDEDLLSGLEFYRMRKEQSLEIDDTIRAINDLRMITLALDKLGRINASELTFVEAISLSDQYSHRDTLLNVRLGLYNQLGKIYRQNKNFIKGIEVYNKAMSYAQNSHDTITIFNNLSNIYKDNGEYSSALNFLERALSNDQISNDSILFARVLDNFGYNQWKLDIPSGINNMIRASEIRSATGDISGLFSSFQNLSRYFYEDNKEIALDYAYGARRIADSLNNHAYKISAMRLLLDFQEFGHFKEYSRLMDSISLADKKTEYKYASYIYDVEKERRLTQASRLREEKQKGEKRLLAISLIALIIVALLVLIMLRNRYKREKLKEVYKTESEISKKVHDEVANDVYQVMAKLQSHSNSNDELLDDLDNIYSRTRDISKEYSLVDVETNFGQQLEDLFRSYETPEISVVTQNNAKVEWNEISELKKKTIYKVLQELLTNMRKHSKASHVLIKFTQLNRKISIDYKDNGVGCSLEKSNGLQNVENRMEALKGRITFETEPNKGFEAKMEV